ncbi:DUF885 domain-containing protein [soil metagenome]
MFPSSPAARSFSLGLVALIGLAGCSTAPVASPSFEVFVDDYFQSAYEFSPTNGVSQGFHEFDRAIEDLSAASYERRMAVLDVQQIRLDTWRDRDLSPTQRIDAVMIDNAIKSELFQLRTLDTWHTNPMGYVGAPGSAADMMMKRDFAPKRERLESLIVRLQGVPPMIAAMKANVRTAPKEFTDLSIRIAQGSVAFFRESALIWARDAAGRDRALLARFTVANEAAAKALEDAVAWLRSDLLPRSTASFAIGTDNFVRQLQIDEMVDIPLPRLLAIGEANLTRDHEAFVATARLIDASKTPAEVMSDLSSAHPTAQSLLPDTKKSIEGTRQFLIDHHIVTVPTEVRPNVAETPPYARAGSFASMDTPGPYERATEAYYYVTPPEADWDAKHVEEHLRAFNVYTTDIVTIHEVFPGHYLQFIYSQRFPTKTRKLLGAASNSEGWAHYTEQMMVDEGFGGGDPKVRLAQLSDALLRDCRFVVGIKLHTEGWTVEQGAKLFADQCYQEPANGYEEARRGAYNPTYLYYTLGKLQIQKLRDDVRRAQGASFSLQQFHDRFVTEGTLPIKLLRPILLPGDSGPTL